MEWDGYLSKKCYIDRSGVVNCPGASQWVAIARRYRHFLYYENNEAVRLWVHLYIFNHKIKWCKLSSWRCLVPLINQLCMMMSSNGIIFRVTGPLCGEFTGPGEFPTQRPVTRSFDVFLCFMWMSLLIHVLNPMHTDVRLRGFVDYLCLDALLAVAEQGRQRQRS